MRIHPGLISKFDLVMLVFSCLWNTLLLTRQRIIPILEKEFIGRRWGPIWRWDENALRPWRYYFVSRWSVTFFIQLIGVLGPDSWPILVARALRERPFVGPRLMTVLFRTSCPRGWSADYKDLAPTLIPLHMKVSWLSHKFISSNHYSFFGCTNATPVIFDSCSDSEKFDFGWGWLING
jgi:hypothetical protein